MAPDSIKGPLGIDERRMLVFAHQCGGPDGSLFALLRYTYKFVQVQRRPQGYRCYKSMCYYSLCKKMCRYSYLRYPSAPSAGFRMNEHGGSLESCTATKGRFFSRQARAQAVELLLAGRTRARGQGHGPPMPSLLRYGAVLELDGNRGLLISYPPYHMCINTVLGQVMFQIAGFESKLQVKVTSQMVIRVKISHLFMANLVNDKAMAAPSPI
ncbi:hypothetical protein MCOR02_000738 [Pyricularia oryzae]|nr:hypothetical protein MCOR02_000738 [Pyricularia oryzae]KAI6261715.1 hypothetical protein MCOR19_002045 [Pyricularia oryzae]KAI6313631.1 hypothetical protein MCOR30_010224 [Pyricularia oryzae]KAI6437184.1 hypothetical protein MCOR21_000646 [Pyricularia oryzae]KAI6438236.1 hypothetical protein MCOR24_000159 [Pyricularia oryzae]